jgi:hypothetical protein
MRKPAGRGLLLGLAPLGPFARSTEIDKVAHAKFGGNQMCGFGHPGLFGLEELRRHGDARFTATDSRCGSQFKLP